MTSTALAENTSAYATHDQPHQYDSLVRRIAHHLANRLPPSVQLDDLLQAGTIGLLEASQHYDASRGANFDTFAGFRIRGAMLDELRKGDWTPRSLYRQVRRITKAIEEIEAEQGADAEDWQVAARLQITLEGYRRILGEMSTRKICSLEELSGIDEQILEDNNDDPLRHVEIRRFQQALLDTIANLPGKEGQVISMYYAEGLKMREIGLRLGYSESRISQLRSQALMRLKTRLQEWDM